MISVQACTEVIARILPEPYAGLLSGIAFGAKQALSPEFKTILTDTGVMHMVALSGANIAMITSAVSGVLLKFCHRMVASALTVVAIVGFVAFVGATPSVVRAAVMGSIPLVAVITGRESTGRWSWLVTVLGIAAFAPAWLGSLSFQLSALASLGILLFAAPETAGGEGGKTYHSGCVTATARTDGTGGPGMHENSKGPVRQLFHYIISNLRVSLAAQVFTLPLMAFTFRKVSVLAPLVNLSIDWCIPQVTILGLIAGFLGNLWLPLAIVPAWIAYGLLWFMCGVLEWFSRIPFVAVGW